MEEVEEVGEIQVVSEGLRAKDYWVLGGVVGALYIVSRLWLKKTMGTVTQIKSTGKSEKEEVAFERFRRVYVLAYVLALGAEYIQTAQTFALLRHGHRAGYKLIAEVYAIGFAASWLASACIGIFREALPTSRRLKIECALCMTAYAGAGFAVSHWGSVKSEEHPDAAIAIIAYSRVAVGMALPLLQNSFDAWMRSAHSGLGFAPAWKRKTYEACGSGTTLASVIAGIVVEFSRRQLDEAAPFRISILVALIGLLVVCFAWPGLTPSFTTPSGNIESSRGTASFCTKLFDFFGIFRRGCTGLRSIPYSALLVAFTASLFEVAAYVTSATWATTLCRIHDHSSHRTPFYGYVFSLLMASAVIGTLLFQIFSINKYLSQEQIAFMLAVIATTAFGRLALDHSTYNATRAALPPLLLFQFTVGWSMPILASLKVKYIPTEIRATVSRIFNFFYGIAIIILILLIPANTRLTFLILGISMAFASLSILLLYVFFARRPAHLLPIRQTKGVSAADGSSGGAGQDKRRGNNQTVTSDDGTTSTVSSNGTSRAKR